MAIDTNRKRLIGAVYMFLLSTVMLISVVWSWEGSPVNYFIVLACVFGYGVSGIVLRRYYRSKKNDVSHLDIPHIKRRLVKHSLITYMLTTVAVEIILYFQGYSFHTLLLALTLCVGLMGPVIFFTLRTEFRKMEKTEKNRTGTA